MKRRNLPQISPAEKQAKSENNAKDNKGSKNSSTKVTKKAGQDELLDEKLLGSLRLESTIEQLGDDDG